MPHYDVNDCCQKLELFFYLIVYYVICISIKSIFETKPIVCHHPLRRDFNWKITILRSRRTISVNNRNDLRLLELLMIIVVKIFSVYPK